MVWRRGLNQGLGFQVKGKSRRAFSIPVAMVRRREVVGRVGGVFLLANSGGSFPRCGGSTIPSKAPAPLSSGYPLPLRILWAAGVSAKRLVFAAPQVLALAGDGISRYGQSVIPPPGPHRGGATGQMEIWTLGGVIGLVVFDRCRLFRAFQAHPARGFN